MSLEREFKKSLLRVLRIIIPSRRIPILNLKDGGKILVIRQHNQPGDMLCVVPLLRALKSRFPRTHISLLASPVNADVMVNNRFLDELIIFDKREMVGRFSVKIVNIISFVRKLRSCRFDAAIVPATVSMSFTSDLIAYLSGSPVRIGASELDGAENPARIFVNYPVALDWRGTPHRHQTLRNLDIARDLGLLTSDLSTEMTLTGAEIEEGRSFVVKALGKKSVGLGIHPGAGKAPNRWSTTRFAEVANGLMQEFNAHVFVTCGPMDDEPVEQMISRLAHDPTLIRSAPIRFVASVLHHMSLVISNDTGIMHVAAAVGAPVLSLFGPTDPEQWAPIDGKSRFIYGNGRNVQNITVEEVLRMARDMLLSFRG